MSLHRFFVFDQVIGEQDEEAFILRLSEDDRRHAQVVRLNPGEHIAVIDAAQDYFECQVVEFDGGNPVVRIAQKLGGGRQRPTVVLMQGIAKGEKMDTVVRQATELGVSGIIPFASERSVVKLSGDKAAAKVKRWRSIAKNAAMQSGQTSIPEVSEPMGLPDACSFCAQANAVIICWEEETGRSLQDLLSAALGKQLIEPADARIVVVVGPEGGLSQPEVASFVEANRFAGTVSLGPSILRTETAGIVAPALVLYELGALG